jgi:hypothetical protein
MGSVLMLKDGASKEEKVAYYQGRVDAARLFLSVTAERAGRPRGRSRLLDLLIIAGQVMLSRESENVPEDLWQEIT